jgi:glutamate/tyrosine decarboxylase-like PLP-dependent enzyme
VQFPDRGLSRAEVLQQLQALRAQDTDLRGGQLFSLLYHAGDEVDRLLHEASDLFLMTNGLNPMAFPSLRQMEAEVVSMTADLLGSSEAVGTLTSGGTESILLAVRAARDLARVDRGVTSPEMLLPPTAHPAFEKAAHSFGLAPVRIPLRDDLRADPKAARQRITRNTALIVGSAPCYPFGLVDPVEDLAAIAAEHGLPCHVDACLGGYLLPHLRDLGQDVPPFDFTVDGVTSISADLHKYGYATKGVSALLYRNRELRRHQFFVSESWSGGLYASPGMAGSRPGAPIASAWAVLRHLGRDGYRRLASDVLDATRRMLAGLRSIDGIEILGDPDMSVIAFTSDVFDVFELADALDEQGWHLDRQQLPPSLHLMLSPVHKPLVDPFLSDLSSAVLLLRSGAPAPEGQAGMYGMLGSATDRSSVRQFMLDCLDGLYQPGA